MIFLSAGLKYHDITVRIKSKNAGTFSVMESPDAICENTAPDMAKKKPAYAHSFSKGNLGISKATTPRIFQMPSIVRK